MKAVVVEIRDGFAALLSDDGCITKVRNKNYILGQVIEMNKQILQRISKLTACVAAALFMLFGAGVWAYATPYSYVSLDVNPSITYSLNRFDIVLSVTAVNDEGEAIIKEIQLDKLTNKKIEKAIAKTLEQIDSIGYLDGDTEGGIVIAAASKNAKKGEGLAKKLDKLAKDETEDNEADVEVETISVGLERVLQAKELGVTPGKLNLVEKLQASTDDADSINQEEWLNKPVKEIMKEIKVNREAQKAANKARKNNDDEDKEEDEDIVQDESIDEDGVEDQALIAHETLVLDEDSVVNEKENNKLKPKIKLPKNVSNQAIAALEKAANASANKGGNSSSNAGKNKK